MNKKYIYRYTPEKRKELNQKENEVRQSNKSKLIQILGGNCQKCGYNKSEKALDFHHLNQKTKKFAISDRLSVRNELKWQEIIEEVKKCELLCANCHRELTHIY